MRRWVCGWLGCGRRGDRGRRGRCSGNLGYDLLWLLAAHTHVQRIVFAVVTFDLQFGQIVLAQDCGQRLDEINVAVSLVFFWS